MRQISWKLSIVLAAPSSFGVCLANLDKRKLRDMTFSITQYNQVLKAVDVGWSTTCFKMFAQPWHYIGGWCQKYSRVLSVGIIHKYHWRIEVIIKTFIGGFRRKIQTYAWNASTAAIKNTADAAFYTSGWLILLKPLALLIKQGHKYLWKDVKQTQNCIKYFIYKILDDICP
jgi:hypothetical protein